MHDEITDINILIEHMKGNNTWSLLRDNKLANNLIEHYVNNDTFGVDWFAISNYQTLSEEFISKYKDNIKWNAISLKQKLSERFLDTNKDKVNWILIISNNDYQINFIEKYIYYFNLYKLSLQCNKSIVNRLIYKYKDKYTIDKLSCELE